LEFAKTKPTQKGFVMPKKRTQKPGEKPYMPGEYIERGRRGGKIKDPRVVTIEPGDAPLPPTQEPGHTWERKGPPKP
jgi:hypothetical protein